MREFRLPGERPRGRNRETYRATEGSVLGAGRQAQREPVPREQLTRDVVLAVVRVEQLGEPPGLAEVVGGELGLKHQPLSLLEPLVLAKGGGAQFSHNPRSAAPGLRA